MQRDLSGLAINNTKSISYSVCFLLIQLLISKRLVNIYKYKGLQLTVNSITELKEARKKIGKYFTYDEKF